MINATCSAAKAGGLPHASAAGLVTSKTTVNVVCASPVNSLSINLSKPECALRRVRRLKRSVWASGHLHGIANRGFRAPVCWFITLTYAKADFWQPEHIKTAINRYRRFCKQSGVPCRYTWVAEIQPKRLANTGKAVVHYHVLAWLPQGVRMPQWDRDTTKREAFWPHGMTNTDIAFSGVGYLMKYLSKLGELTIFPKGLRLYGIGGLDAQARGVRAWYNLPEWCKAEYGVGELVRKACGFVVCATGEILAPAYKVSFVHGSIIVQALREFPKKFHDGAYSKVSFA